MICCGSFQWHAFGVASRLGHRSRVLLFPRSCLMRPVSLTRCFWLCLLGLKQVEHVKLASWLLMVEKSKHVLQQTIQPLSVSTNGTCMWSRGRHAWLGSESCNGCGAFAWSWGKPPSLAGSIFRWDCFFLWVCPKHDVHVAVHVQCMPVFFHLLPWLFIFISTDLTEISRRPHLTNLQGP